jgi:uncharacterized repeat protein (TIGR03803 family)
VRNPSDSTTRAGVLWHPACYSSAVKPFFIAAALLALATASPAQTFTVLHSFTNVSDGKRPESSLALSSNTLYGTTSSGGSAYHGTLFKVNTDGSGYSVLHSSSAPDWVYPKGVIVSGSTLYGTTEQGGTESAWYGTVFKINTDGNDYTVIKTFTNGDGAYPEAGLVLDGDTLYGTTASGGTRLGGTVFKLNTNGSDFAVIHEFSDSGGNWPVANLILDGSTLYGITLWGGTGFSGTVFRLSTDGSGFTVLHNFSGVDTNTAWC